MLLFHTVGMEHRWTHSATRQERAEHREEQILHRNRPREIAKAIKHAADLGDGPRTIPYREARALLNAYMHHGVVSTTGQNPRMLKRAKTHLRRIYHRDETES